jgi:ribonuclease R
MLPPRLSDHLCSLRSDGDRFALSVSLDVAPDGRSSNPTFYRSLIRVRENLSYATALERAKAGDATFAGLLDLAARMQAHRRGLALETGELKVLVGAAGFSALEKRADEATRMIEAFMVAANEAVAQHLTESGVACLFRCHPLPEPAKAERLVHQLATMGIEARIELPRKPAATGAAAPETLMDRLAKGGKLNLFGGGVEVEAEGEPAPSAAPEPLPGYASLGEEEREAWLRPFRALVETLGAHPDPDLAEVATLKLLGCMGRAFYSPDNVGHFGLGLVHYAHFTSPIRRYPDLVVHRNLAWLIAGKPGAAPHSQESLRALCDHCSNQERAADGLERRVKAACLVLAAPDGSASPARVTGITPGNLFTLRKDGLEARVPLREVPGGPFDVDEWESALMERQPADWRQAGAEPRTLLRLGDKVTVRLAERDVAAGRTSGRFS